MKKFRIIIVALLFLTSETYTLKAQTTVTIYHLGEKDFIFLMDSTYYVPFYTCEPITDDEVIMELEPTTMMDTLLIEPDTVEATGTVYFADEIRGMTKSDIYDIYVNGTELFAIVHKKKDGKKRMHFRLNKDEKALLAFLMDKIVVNGSAVYIPSNNVYTSSDYYYVISLQYRMRDCVVFVGGNYADEPQSCNMMSAYLRSLVRKYENDPNTTVITNQTNSLLLDTSRLMLDEMMEDYHISAPEPIAPY